MHLRRLLRLSSNTYWATLIFSFLGVLFLLLWSWLTARSLGLEVETNLLTIFTILKSGFIIPAMMSALIIITPLAALVCFYYGREYRLVSHYLFWNWAASLVASSFALYCFSSWQSISVGVEPWNAIALFYELDHRSILFQRWMLCLIGCLIPVIVFNFLSRMNVQGKAKAALGSAHFASVLEINRAKLFDKEGVVIGQAHGKILRVPGFESVLLTASTGSGKTSSIAIPNLIEHQGSAIINDLKGELYRLTARYRTEQDQNKCYFFNPMDDKIQDFYNPFFYVRKDKKKRIDDLMIIAEALIQETKMGEGFWYQASRNVFVLLSLFLLETKGKATLADVYDLSKQPALHDFLDKGIELKLSHCSDTLKEGIKDFCKSGLPFSTAILTQNAASFSEVPDKTRLNILTDFHSRMTSLMSLSIRKATSKNTFDLRKLRKEKMSIYIHIPPSSKKTLSPILTVFWAQVTHLLTKTEPDFKEEPHAVLCLLDEFGMIDKIDRIKESLSFLRSYRVRFLIIVQYLNQIVAAYGKEDADSFFNNTKTKIYFTSTDYQDAHRISQSLGVKAAKIENRSVNTGSFQSNGHVTLNQNYQSVPLMRPDELMQLDEKSAIILVAGHPPIKAKKVYWFKNYHYKHKLGK